MKPKHYTAVISSDWNQCLAPCGPFDPIIYTYPKLTAELSAVFKAYTGNHISLGRASATIQALLPAPLSAAQMDSYLDAAFATYDGVADLIEWCLGRDVLFMINTTGLTGYFQRVFAKGLLPPVPVLSSNAMLRYPAARTDPHVMLDLEEIMDKGRNTEWVIQQLENPPPKCILMGDSGGDGPHFEWGAAHGAFLVASMPKPSLLKYCRKEGIEIDLFVGTQDSHAKGADRNGPATFDFMDLTAVIDELSGVGGSVCRF